MKLLEGWIQEKPAASVFCSETGPQKLLFLVVGDFIAHRPVVALSFIVLSRTDL
jgi:hypothetical protein